MNTKSIQAQLEELAANNSQVESFSVYPNEVNVTLWKKHNAKEENLYWEALQSLREITGLHIDDDNIADGDGVDYVSVRLVDYGTYEKDGERFVADSYPEPTNLAGFEGMQVFSCEATDEYDNKVTLYLAFDSDEEEASNLN